MSCSITKTVAVRGGGIDLEAPMHDAWIIQPIDVDVQVDGARDISTFVSIYRGNHRCKQYFSCNFEMLEYIIGIRNREVD